MTLANWAYAVSALAQDSRGQPKPIVRHVPVENLTITIRGAGSVSKVSSCALDQGLQSSISGDTITVTLPRLEEGDVLRLQ